MTERKTNEAARARRERDLERAVETLRSHQKARIHGVVAFHLQGGRIVRSEVRTTQKF